ncbi:MAG: hypothetical protein FRX49_10695 [Trebouxia sp. A1-2]|nr:MAG: hypothetical protein FRX49_10695 [Trebouxia sp. A1-2]
MAISVTTSGTPREIYTHKTIAITSSPKTGEKTFEHMKEEIEMLKSRYNIVVIAVISDAAGEAAKARRLLRAWRPELLTVDCFSHQFNLSVGDYLNKKKTDHIYLDTVADAIDMASWWIKHSVPHGMLLEKQITVLGKTSALTSPVVTRWGSHYNAFKQLLQSERSIELLILEKREELLKSVGKQKASRELAEKILDLCENSTFWAMLRVVLGHLGPLLIAVRAVESEQTKLDRVLKLLGFLHQHFSGVLDGQVKKVMLDGLEKRFADYDQPALLIAYMLNPQRQQQFLNPNCDFVSWRNAVILVELLYIRFFPDATDASKSAVANQFLSYINKEDPFDERTLNFACKPGRSPERLWNMVKKDAPELSQLALRLMGIAVNSAGCERLFSQMGLTHTKVRNRLGHAKVTHIA